jgi:hypothetical protein
MDERLELQGDRALLIQSLRESSGELRPLLVAPFAAMLPAFDEGEGMRATMIVQDLVLLGCVEFSFVGPEAERLHDAIDQVLEDSGALNIVTTWHHDLAEGCEYFVLAAGGRPGVLLALVAEHPEAVELLRRAAEE